jgi:hypothetical protein
VIGSQSVDTDQDNRLNVRLRGGGGLQPIENRARAMSMMIKKCTLADNYSQYLKPQSCEGSATAEDASAF